MIDTTTAALPSPQRNHRTPTADDRGSTTVEIAVAIPIFVALLMLMITSGRYTTAMIEVQGAAGAATRAASLARSPAAAQAAATDSAQALAGCTHHDSTVDTSAFRPGGVVTVTVRCTISTRLLTGFGLPGAVSVVGTSSSPVDTYRSVVTDTR